MKLIEPSEEYSGEISAFRQEFLNAGEHMDGCGMLRSIADPIEWIKNSRLRSSMDTTTDETGVYAKQWMLVSEDDLKIVGMLQYRPQSNIDVRVGYCVRPSMRRHGYALMMLKSFLSMCRDNKMEDIYISCETDNEASRKTLLKAGGIKAADVDFKGISLERYKLKCCNLF